MFYVFGFRMLVVVCGGAKHFGVALEEWYSKTALVDFIYVDAKKFADGETSVMINNLPFNLCNDHIVVVQSFSGNVNDNLQEMFLVINALKNAGAVNIHVLNPYMCYSRQDRLMMRGSPISAQFVASVLMAQKIRGFITVDVHNEAIAGLFHDIEFVNVNSLEYFVKSITNVCGYDNIVIVAPDSGALKRCREIAAKMNAGIAVVDKQRDAPGVSSVVSLIGDVSDKICVVCDDIVDSGGTLCNTVDFIKNSGAKSVYACITHGVLSAGAVDKIRNSSLTALIVSDSLSGVYELDDSSKIIVKSLSEMLVKYLTSKFVG